MRCLTLVNFSYLDKARVYHVEADSSLTLCGETEVLRLIEYELSVYFEAIVINITFI